MPMRTSVERKKLLNNIPLHFYYLNFLYIFVIYKYNKNQRYEFKFRRSNNLGSRCSNE